MSLSLSLFLSPSLTTHIHHRHDISCTIHIHHRHIYTHTGTHAPQTWHTYTTHTIKILPQHFKESVFKMFIFCVWVFARIKCLYTVYVTGARGGQKKTSDLLELKLQIVKSHHVGAEEQSHVFWKSSQPVLSRLSHLSSPQVSECLNILESAFTANLGSAWSQVFYSS